MFSSFRKLLVILFPFVFIRRHSEHFSKSCIECILAIEARVGGNGVDGVVGMRLHQIHGIFYAQVVDVCVGGGTGAIVTCIILGLILLIVPAINVSGLISSQMSRRLSELAVRKAYGASRSTLIGQLLLENMLLAFIGALLGFLLSCLLLWLGKDWMLAGGYTEGNFEVSIWLFLRPTVLLSAAGVCLLFNLLSVFILAWNATRRPIAEVISGE